MIGLEIKIERTTAPKARPDYSNLGFGRSFTDHMFIMNYTEGKGWHDPRIVPYAPFVLEPSCMVFHYGQETFEGMKAYLRADGDIQLFRPKDNFRRMNDSDARLCIPELDVDFCVEAVKTLLKVDRDWMPTEPGTSMYIRPFVIATDPHLGVHASKTYIFAIILSPSGAYYTGGLAPVKIYVETEDVRAVRGGTGEAKTGGNYSASIRAQERAGSRGYEQVLWLDGVERKYIEEVGAMNVFFKIDGTVVTPALVGSILPGITRRSCIELLKKHNIPVEERRLSLEELKNAARDGRLEEAFGSGTAAVISPIGELAWEGEKFTINGGKIGKVSQWLYDTLTDLQWGRSEDPFGWTMIVK